MTGLKKSHHKIIQDNLIDHVHTIDEVEELIQIFRTSEKKKLFRLHIEMTTLRGKNILALTAISNIPSIIGTQIEDDDNEYPAIHIRIKQRKGKKMVTTVEGISECFDHDKILSYMKKEFQCGGNVVRVPIEISGSTKGPRKGTSSEEAIESNVTVLQFSGDQREGIKVFLLREEITISRYITIHGY